MASLAELLTKEDLQNYIDTIGYITDVEFATSITEMDVTPEELTLLIMCYRDKVSEIGT